MIKCYVNEDGFYIIGDGVEVARKLTRLMPDTLQHLYAVMYCAMVDLKGRGKDRVFIYNDSRIIDDLNGKQPLDAWFESVRRMMRQRLLPDIGGVVFFSKKSARNVSQAIERGFESLSVDDTSTNKRLLDEIMTCCGGTAKLKAKNLKKRWFNAKAK